MRVTGGDLRGRTLTAPYGLQVRPTTDKIRQAIFNILAYETPDARALDLFCGSGALGIEALSRGAESVIFVDQGAKSITALKENLASLGLDGEILKHDWREAVRRLRGRGVQCGLVFADPPYRRVSASTIWRALTEKPDQSPSLLAEGGILIIESAADETPAQRARILKERVFGQTKVTFYTHPNPE